MKDLIRIMSDNYEFVQKFNYLKYRFSKKGLILNYSPIVISIVATGRCNLSCDMCPTHSKYASLDYEWSQKTNTDMDFATFKKIVDIFDKAIQVQIIGAGEPFLNKDFFQMVDYAAKTKKMKVKTVTNGILLSKFSAQIVSSMLDSIIISINGHTPDEFSRMTGMSADLFDTIINGIKQLREDKLRYNPKLKIKLSFIIDKHNYYQIPKMIDLGLSLNVDQMFFCNFLPSPFNGFRPEERMLFSDDQEAFRIILGFIKEFPPLVRKKIALPLLIDRNKLRNRCQCHFYQIRVDSIGDVGSCSMMLLNMQNNGKFTEHDIWNNKFFQEMRNKFLNGKIYRYSEEISTFEPCCVCPSNRGVSLGL